MVALVTCPMMVDPPGSLPKTLVSGRRSSVHDWYQVNIMTWGLYSSKGNPSLYLVIVVCGNRRTKKWCQPTSFCRICGMIAWIPWNLSFRYSHCTGQFTPKMKANAEPRLLSSLVWIDSGVVVSQHHLESFFMK